MSYDYYEKRKKEKRKCNNEYKTKYDLWLNDKNYFFGKENETPHFRNILNNKSKYQTINTDCISEKIGDIIEKSIEDNDNYFIDEKKKVYPLFKQNYMTFKPKYKKNMIKYKKKNKIKSESFSIIGCKEKKEDIKMSILKEKIKFLEEQRDSVINQMNSIGSQRNITKYAFDTISNENATLRVRALKYENEVKKKDRIISELENKIYLMEKEFSEKENNNMRREVENERKIRHVFGKVKDMEERLEGVLKDRENYEKVVREKIMKKEEEIRELKKKLIENEMDLEDIKKKYRNCSNNNEEQKKNLNDLYISYNNMAKNRNNNRNKKKRSYTGSVDNIDNKNNHKRNTYTMVSFSNKLENKKYSNYNNI